MESDLLMAKEFKKLVAAFLLLRLLLSFLYIFIHYIFLVASVSWKAQSTCIFVIWSKKKKKYSVRIKSQGS